jgi:hypothetical protein
MTVFVLVEPILTYHTVTLLVSKLSTSTASAMDNGTLWHLYGFIYFVVADLWVYELKV